MTLDQYSAILFCQIFFGHYLKFFCLYIHKIQTVYLHSKLLGHIIRQERIQRETLEGMVERTTRSHTDRQHQGVGGDMKYEDLMRTQTSGDPRYPSFKEETDDGVSQSSCHMICISM